MTFLGPIERLKMWDKMRAGSYTLGRTHRRETDGDEIDAPAALEARYTFHPFKSEAME